MSLWSVSLSGPGGEQCVLLELEAEENIADALCTLQDAGVTVDFAINVPHPQAQEATQ